MSDAVFWDRLAEMPYSEAIEELKARRAELVQERADAEKDRGTPRWDGVADQHRAAQSTKINGEIGRINRLRNGREWKDAVIALYGLDAYNECARWIAQQDPLA